MKPMMKEFVPYILEGLGQLNVEELYRLKQSITPDMAYLLTKAFGAEMGSLVWPLIEQDPRV